jgi:putative transposase
MVNYRRALVPGGTFFFTVALQDRSQDTFVRYIDDLQQAFRETKAKHPWQTNAIVVLPEHLHALWTLPEGDTDYSGRWRAIKSKFVRRLRRASALVRTNSKGDADVWQRRFWEHAIRDDADFARHVDYIHINPVKHGHVARATDWRWSSIHRFVERGVVAPDWAADTLDGSGFGE